MFSIGTDPEFMLRDSTRRIVSAIPYISGNKEEPIHLSCGGNLSHDNVTLEFSTIPAKSSEEFVGVIKTTLEEVLRVIPKGFTIIPKSSHLFNKVYLEHPDARRFGCDPDYDAWEVRENIAVAPTSPLRSCGAHIHVGHIRGAEYKFLKDDVGKIYFIRLMDVIVGITMMTKDISSDSVRRKKLYGKAGCFRPTSYGAEYRVLGNFWISSPQSVRLVYSLVEDTLNLVELGEYNNIIEEVGGKNTIKAIINTGLFVEAFNLVNSIIKKYLSDNTIKLLDKLPTEFDFYKEWGLN